MGQASGGPADPAAAKHPFAGVEHRGLARRHRAGRRVENELGVALLRTGIEPPRHRRLRRAKLYRDRHTSGERTAEPVQLAKRDTRFRQCRARADDDSPLLGIEPEHIERLAGGDPEPPALADGKMGDAIVAAEHATAAVDDVTGLGGLWSQPLDEPRIGPVRHEADVLAVRLVRDRKAETPCRGAGLVLRKVAQRKPQEFQFLPRRCKQEIALVARRIPRPMQLRPSRPGDAAHIMAGRERAGTEVARDPEKTAKLDPLVAANARDRGLTTAVIVDKIVDDCGAKAALVVEHVMGDAEMIGDLGGIVYVPPGTTSAGTSCGGAVVVELQRGADDLEALLDEQCRGYGRVDPTRHRYDDAMTGRITGKVEVRCAHEAASRPICQKSASSRAAVPKVAASDGKRPSPPRRENCSSSAAAASRARVW